MTRRYTYEPRWAGLTKTMRSIITNTPAARRGGYFYLPGRHLFPQICLQIVELRPGSEFKLLLKCESEGEVLCLQWVEECEVALGGK